MISITCQERVIHKLFQKAFVMLCGIWYHLYNLKNVKNTHGAVLLLVKLQTEAWNFTKSNTAPWVFFTFFKLYKWHQNAQSIGIISIKIFPERVSSSRQLNIWSFSTENKSPADFLMLTFRKCAENKKEWPPIRSVQKKLFETFHNKTTSRLFTTT